MFKINNLLDFGFPIYLIIFELSFRFVSAVDVSSFIGPALAVSGLSLLIGIIKPKRAVLDEAITQYLKQQNLLIVIRNPKDENLISIGWSLILVEILGWYWSCAMTIQNDKQHLHSYWPLLVGIIIYCVSVILSIIKENI